MHWNGFESEKSCSQSAIRKGLGLLVPPPSSFLFLRVGLSAPRQATNLEGSRALHPPEEGLGTSSGLPKRCSTDMPRGCAARLRCRGSGRFLCINHRQPGSQPSLLPQPQQGLLPNGLASWIVPLLVQLQEVHRSHSLRHSCCCRH